LFFKLEPIYLDPGEVLLYEGDETNQLFFIEKGKLEIYIELDGQEYIIEYLGPGSVLNYTVVFMTDPMIVNIRAIESTYISYLLEDDMEKMKSEDVQFGKKLS
jgi:CRP-like cAMP-binding protein